MNEIADTLRRLRWFARLPAADLDPLVSAFTISDHRDGHVFVRQGHPADGAFLVLSGEVLVSRAREGGQHDVVNRLHAGELFGIVALLDDGPRSASCIAAGNVRVAWLPRGAFQVLAQADAPAAHAMQRAVASQLCADMRRLQDDIRDRLRRAG